jgi:hypothetical protein
MYNQDLIARLDEAIKLAEHLERLLIQWGIDMEKRAITNT